MTRALKLCIFATTVLTLNSCEVFIPLAVVGAGVAIYDQTNDEDKAMPLYVNGAVVEPDTVVCNGEEIDSVYCNGEEVWSNGFKFIAGVSGIHTGFEDSAALGSTTKSLDPPAKLNLSPGQFPLDSILYIQGTPYTAPRNRIFAQSSGFAQNIWTSVSITGDFWSGPGTYVLNSASAIYLSDFGGRTVWEFPGGITPAFTNGNEYIAIFN